MAANPSEKQSPRLRDQYDWVVLGDDPGALLSACMAARLGLSVLVLPVARGHRLRVSESGQVMDPEPNVVMALAKNDAGSGILAACLAKLGLTAQEEALIRPTGVLPQVVTPGARLELASPLKHEIEREFGPAVSGRMGFGQALELSEPEFRRFWLELPARLTLDPQKSKKKGAAGSLSLEKVQSRLARGAGLKDAVGRGWFAPGKRASDLARLAGCAEIHSVLAGLWYGLTGSVARDPEIRDLLHVAGVSQTAASYRGGLSAYRDLLLRLARRLGAHLSDNAECRRLFVQNGQFVGVQITSHGNMIGAGGGVLGCGIHQVKGLLSLSGRNWLRHLKAAPKPAGWRFTVALTAHAEAVPPGMSSRMVWQEPEAPPFEIEVADPTDYGLREAGTRILYLRTVLPFTEESLKRDYQRLMATRMLRKAGEILPFLEFHVTRIYPDFRDDPKSSPRSKAKPKDFLGKDELREAYGFSNLAEIPIELRCFDGPGTGSRSGIEGLFVASNEAFPSYGSLGSTVAAIESVAWLAHRSGLSGPFV